MYRKQHQIARKRGVGGGKIAEAWYKYPVENEVDKRCGHTRKCHSHSLFLELLDIYEQRVEELADAACGYGSHNELCFGIALASEDKQYLGGDSHDPDCTECKCKDIRL